MLDWNELPYQRLLLLTQLRNIDIRLRDIWRRNGSYGVVYIHRELRILEIELSWHSLSFQMVNLVMLLELSAPLNILLDDLLLVNNTRQVIELVANCVPHEVIKSLGLRILTRKELIKRLLMVQISLCLLHVFWSELIFVPLLLALFFDDILQSLTVSHHIFSVCQFRNFRDLDWSIDFIHRTWVGALVNYRKIWWLGSKVKLSFYQNLNHSLPFLELMKAQ